MSLRLRPRVRRPKVGIPEVRERTEPPLGVFWDPIITDRAQRRRLRQLGADKQRAVVTIVHNEPVFMPIWLEYYSRFFAAEDIYVIDNDTDDGSTDGDGFVRIPAHHDRADNIWMVQTVERIQRELIEGRYDVVLVTDVDEIVTPIPEWGTLGDYLDEFAEWFVNCIGYELIHLIDREPPYDPSRPILDQRGYWFANAAYNKPAIASTAMSWQPGFHKKGDGEFNYAPELRMIHLHRMDFEICRERHRSRADRAWDDRDKQEGWGVHNWPSEEAEFERWFYEDSSVRGSPIEVVVERIPAEWRGLF